MGHEECMVDSGWCMVKKEEYLTGHEECMVYGG